MRKISVLLITCVGLAAMVWAQEGFKRTRTVDLTNQAKVGSQVLPAGQYKVSHTMEGAEHVMLFQKGDQQYRVKCNMEPLTQKARATQYFYEHATGERVLQAIEFRGDTVRHVFEQ
jgi:hypothetical protein